MVIDIVVPTGVLYNKSGRAGFVVNHFMVNFYWTKPWTATVYSVDRIHGPRVCPVKIVNV